MRADLLQLEISKIIDLEEEVRRYQMIKATINNGEDCSVILGTKKNNFSFKVGGEFLKEILDKFIEESLFNYSKRIELLEKQGVKVHNIFKKGQE
jgi:hypothetical protein